MKKMMIFAIAATFVGGCAANAGLLDSLGLTQKAEPKTLAEACDTNEIKKLCPEMLFGTMTMADCLKNNVQSLSKQCSDYVKKSIASGSEEFMGKLGAMSAESDAAAAARAAKAAEATNAVNDTIESAKKTGALLKNLF